MPRTLGLLIPLAALGLAALAAIPSPAKEPRRAPEIRAVGSRQVSTDAATTRHLESILAIDPSDSRRWLAASMTQEATSVAVYRSSDAGTTWARAVRTDGGNDFPGLDPTAVFDDQGRAYLTAVGDTTVVWVSADSGLHWGAPNSVVAAPMDRPWLVFRRRPEAAGQIVLAGKLPITVFGQVAQDTIAVLRSSDAGRSFVGPKLYLPDPGRELLNVVGDTAVLPNGELLLALETFSPAVIGDELLVGSTTTAISRGGGFSEPRPGPEFRVYGHRREGKSLFGLGGAKLAVDRTTGSRRGRLYMAWLDASSGAYRVRTASSADGGSHWTPAVDVGGGWGTSDASTVAVSVDGRGVAGVAWYDRRADPTDRCYQPYFAASTDGGATWASGPIDSAPTCPLRRDAGDPVASEYRFKNGGDTQGLVGLPDGGFASAWIREFQGELQLWSARIEVR